MENKVIVGSHALYWLENGKLVYTPTRYDKNNGFKKVAYLDDVEKVDLREVKKENRKFARELALTLKN